MVVYPVQVQYQAYAFTPRPLAERTTPDKYAPVRPERYFDVARNQHLLAQTILTQLVTAPVAPTVSGWVGYEPDRVDRLPSRLHLYPSFFSRNLPIGTPATFIEAAVQPQSIPRMDIRRNQYLYPSFTIDTLQLTQKERTSPDKWLGSRPDTIFDVKRQQYTHPYWFSSYQATNPAPPVSPLSWKGVIPEQVWGPKRVPASLYPSFFLGYPWYSPNGCDCFPTTAWTVVDMSIASQWTENAARDATRVTYDAHITYDSHTYYDGVNPALITYPAVSWTPDTPPPTPWTCC